MSKLNNYLIDQYKFSSYTPALMANTKSAIKRIRRISKQTTVNKARKSRYRNALKKMNLLLDGKKKDEALKFLPKLNSELMKIAKTGIIKKENASRNVSRITKKISSI
jgi:small subunit ribosomal protein S20|tara:strand:- start:140 stop:463 length:324 start_codon:yes stop_codon:yes gene_type:complete